MPPDRLQTASGPPPDRLQTGDCRDSDIPHAPLAALGPAVTTKNAHLPPSSVVCSSSNTNMRPSLLTAALFSLALLMAVLRAQEAPSPGAPPPPTDPPNLPISHVCAPPPQV